jgi:hypothetical protein
MMKNVSALKVFIVFVCMGQIVKAGPYNEPGISGYVGPDGKHASPSGPNAVLNPIFRGWATDVASYEPTPDVDDYWKDLTKALGQVTGDNYDIVSLGDLTQDEINQGVPEGWITLVFGDPCEPNDPSHIRDQNGYDFVVFENGFRYADNAYFCELGYVDVSSDGVGFARFPSVSLTPGLVGAYGTVDITDICNLAGKHPNNSVECTGTPFDLNELKNEPNVQNGLVDLNDIAYVRIVDIPGSGDFNDTARKLTDPCTWPNWGYYDANHPVYDAWWTWGSGGFDLEAIGVLHPQQYCGDINLDGIVDYEDLEILAQGWLRQFGQDGWIARCDIAKPKDLIVNFKDFAVFAEDWLKVEQWRNN